MANSEIEKSVALLRRLQIVGPTILFVIALFLFFFWGHAFSPIMAGILILIAIPDYFLIKYLADRIESENNEN